MLNTLNLYMYPGEKSTRVIVKTNMKEEKQSKQT